MVPVIRERYGAAAETDGTVDVMFESIDEARSAVLAWGGAAEVIHPEALRRTVADFARQIAAVYDG